MAVPHCVHALHTDALDSISCRLCMSFDFVHGGSEFVHDSAKDGCALSVCGMGISRYGIHSDDEQLWSFVSPRTYIEGHDKAYLLLTGCRVWDGESLDLDVIDTSDLVVQTQDAESDLGCCDVLLGAGIAFHVVSFEAVTESQISIVAFVR